MESSAESGNLSTPGRRLRAIRNMLGFDAQEVFGEALGGFTQDQVSRAERDIGSIPQQMLKALIEKHGINANWILAGKGEMGLVESIPQPAPSAEVLAAIQDQAAKRVLVGASSVGAPSSAQEILARMGRALDGQAELINILKTVSTWLTKENASRGRSNDH